MNQLESRLFRQNSILKSQTVGNFFCLLNSLAFVGSFLLGFWAEPVVGQRQAQEVITHENGIQFEGERVPIPLYSESLGDSLASNDNPVLMINDGLRRVFFPILRVAGAPAPSDRNETFIDISQKVWGGSQNGYGLLVGMTPFDENGHRLLRVRTDKGVREYVQGITRVGPRYCEVETLTIRGRKDHLRWDMRIATDSIPVDTIVKLMRKQIVDNSRSTEFLKIVELLVQSRKIERAIRELRYIQERFPDEFDDLEKNRKSLRQLFARNVILDEIKQRVAVGQTRVAASLASVFVANDVANVISQEIATIRGEIQQQDENIQNVRQGIQELIARVNRLENSMRLKSKLFPSSAMN